MIIVRPGDLGIELWYEELKGRMTPFYYECGHFAPDHLFNSLNSRSGIPQCVICLGKKPNKPSFWKRKARKP